MNAYQDKLEQLLTSLTVVGDDSKTFQNSFDPNTIPQLVAFTEMIEKWNKSHDLVSQKNSSDIFSHHIIDSLAANLVYLSHHNIENDGYIDIGTGAGLPGIVWKICAKKSLPTVLFEPRAKRVNFLKEVRRQLQLGELDIRESHFDLAGLSLKKPLCSMRALKPEKSMLEQLKKSTDAFTLVSLTTGESTFEDVEFISEKIAYKYSVDREVQRELRIFGSCK